MRRSVAAAGSALFFAIAPGVVAGLVPWWLTGWRVRGPLAHWAPLRVAGLIMLIAGAIVLARAFARFVTEGHGTPAPAAPTERLVIGGLYRYVRNPMYLAVVATITGQALALDQPILLGYAAVVWATTAAFARCYEEPALARQFGAQYEAYRRNVPAWWPRTRPWKPRGEYRTPGRLDRGRAPGRGPCRSMEAAGREKWIDGRAARCAPLLRRRRDGA
jgi:protein-S-isoprenylcysteine O-methyltransferase Ste14